MLFQSLPKMNHKLIARLNLHTVKVDHTRPVSLLQSPSKFCSQRFFFSSTTELSTCSKEINTFKRQNSWTDPFRKLARHLSHQSFLSFCKLQFFTKYAWSTDMLRFLSPVFKVSTRNAWNHDSPFGVHTHKINEKKKKRLHFQSLALLKQAQLIVTKTSQKFILAYFHRKKTSSAE